MNKPIQLKEELEGIISNLQENNYIKAHDDCEDLWRKYKNDDSTREESYILKAFVNGIATLELLNMKRIIHSQNVWKTFKKYEYLIEDLNSLNKEQYKQLQKIIYKIKEKLNEI